MSRRKANHLLTHLSVFEEVADFLHRYPEQSGASSFPSLVPGLDTRGASTLHVLATSSSRTSVPECASLTTSEWVASITLFPFTDIIMSPTSRPELSAGVSGSIAETTTGFEPWIRKPNSPPASRLTTTLLSLSVNSSQSIICLDAFIFLFMALKRKTRKLIKFLAKITNKYLTIQIYILYDI